MKALVLILLFTITSLNYSESVIITKPLYGGKCSEPLKGINVITPGDSDLVELQLQKTVFKKYEPIEILVKYINTGNVSDSIYMMFDDFTNFIDFSIKDDRGVNINEKDKQGFTLGIPLKPNYIVKPLDTLITTITLNGFGKKTENRKTFFQYSNYFPVGKYKFNAVIYGDQHKTFTKPIATTDIEFEIIDIDESDMRVIDLTREGRFNSIQENYSNNYFYEYALREYVKSNIGKFDNNEITKSELENSYIEYFNSFPQSYFTIQFVMQYLSLISNDAATNVDSIAQELLSEHKKSMIEVFLTNSMMLESMKLRIIESRKVEKKKD
jgi:hypothetical protein